MCPGQRATYGPVTYGTVTYGLSTIGDRLRATQCGAGEDAVPPGVPFPPGGTANKKGFRIMPIAYEKEGPGIETSPAEDAPTVPSWSVILDAPDYAKLLKPATSTRAKEYETKVNSVLKEILRYRLTPTGLPDAAAILTYGPDFAMRAGQLADTDPGVAKVLDMLTAPDSPWVTFALVAIPFFGQLFRNHEAQIKELPAKARMSRAERKAEKATQPRAEVRIPGTKRTIKVPFRIKLPLGIFRASTVAPEVLVHNVMSNPDIRKGLTKAYGVTFGENNAQAS
jgi:hypothetical protein